MTIFGAVENNETSVNVIIVAVVGITGAVVLVISAIRCSGS